MEALRAEMSVAELCRKYSINESQFYKWNKEFLEAGKTNIPIKIKFNLIFFEDLLRLILILIFIILKFD
jgi:hypothetical protein